MNLMTKTVLHNGQYILDTPTNISIFEITYQATHVPSDKKVVIKTLGKKLQQHSDFDDIRQQFQKLALRLKRCQHPHLVQILDYFEEASLPYLVLEHIQGPTLAQLIKTQSLPAAKVTQWMRQISCGLNVLHQAGLLHQHIKPEKIIRQQDTGKVALYYSITESIQQTKPTAAHLPIAGYAAPEQYDVETAPSIAIDIYALAATFYCLLSGHPPIPAPVRAILQNSDTASGTISEEERQLQNLEQSNPICREIKQAILQGLELAPQKRPQSVEAWLALFVTSEQNANIKVKAGTITKASCQKNSQSLGTVAKDTNPTPSLSENLVTTFKIPATIKKTQQTAPTTEKRSRSPLRALIMTGAIAAAAGVGFGFALRLNSPTGAGSTLMHTEQSFPPTSNWPLTQPPSKVPL